MIESSPRAVVGVDRRDAVLSSALTTFVRFGYRKTSMDEVARAARISRPGLYFLFASKEELFRAAVVRALDEDLADVERMLGESHRPVDERLLDAFDRWAGQYIGPMSRDITAVIDDNPELLGEVVIDRPQRFADLVTSAFVTSGRSAGTSAALAQTLISASIGLKHQVQDRASYRERLAVAIELLVR
jgi:AcrR family transcriptional regulator